MGKDRSDYIDITWDLRKAEIQNKIRSGISTVGRFISNNKTEVIAFATPILGKLALDAVKGIRSTSRQKQEERFKDRHIWDPSTGMWYETKKKMSSNQRLEFSRRKANGEKVGTILSQMKILK